MTDAYTVIDLCALTKNAAALTEKYSDYKHFIGIVKGDAYGHGYQCVNALEKGGVNFFAVSTIDEAYEFRKYNKTAPLLCLEPVHLRRLDEANDLKLTLAIPDLEYLDHLIDCGCTYPFDLHLQIDSGFNRLGFKDKNEVKKAVDMIKNSPFNLDGVYQHYATVGIFDPYYDAQTAKFRELTSLIDLSEVRYVHLGSGAVTMAHPKEDIANTARFGLVMYGYNIAPESYGGGVKNKLRDMRDKYYQKKYSLTQTIRDTEIDLTPAMSMGCRILQLKNVRKGEHIGYGAAYTAEEDIRIAVLPVGYNNGIGHRNAGRKVEIRGKLYPVAGEIGMNMMCVKVDESIDINDKVTLLGGKITLGMFSGWSGMGLAEALLSVGKNNKQYYVEDK